MFILLWLGSALIVGAVVSSLFTNKMKNLWVYPWAAGMGLLGTYTLLIGSLWGLVYLVGAVGMLIYQLFESGYLTKTVRYVKKDKRTLQEKLQEVMDKRER